MNTPEYPDALVATEVAPNTVRSAYPEPFAARMNQREKRRLGNVFGLSNFGVNLTHLAPGGTSALRHAHSKQDEFIYILEGHPTLQTDHGPVALSPGMCAGFKASTGKAHNLVNNTDKEVCFLEVGDRSPQDECTYPDDDLKAWDENGVWVFTHKDGTPYA